MVLERIIEHGNRSLSDMMNPDNENIIRCRDGFTFSVIAGGGVTHSIPRDKGPFTAVEVGFPSGKPRPWRVWKRYAEDPYSPTETLYSYVPVDTVRELVQRHGGEVERATVFVLVRVQCGNVF